MEKTNPRIGAIKRAINTYIDPSNKRSDFYIEYSNWYCGVTKDETIRKAQHKYGKKVSALYFKAWDAGSKANALAIEKYFHGLGMKGESKSPGGVKPSSKLVYVYKIGPNLIDEIARFFELVE